MEGLATNNIIKICRICMTDTDSEPLPQAMESSFVDLITSMESCKDLLSNVSLPIILCDDCRREFTDWLDFRQMAKESDVAQKKVDRDGMIKYPCDFCDREFILSYNVFRHMLMHSALRPLNCVICSMRFKTVDRVKNHTFHAHLKEWWPEKCQLPTLFQPKQKKQ